MKIILVFQRHPMWIVFILFSAFLTCGNLVSTETSLHSSFSKFMLRNVSVPCNNHSSLKSFPRESSSSAKLPSLFLNYERMGAKAAEQLIRKPSQSKELISHVVPGSGSNDTPPCATVPGVSLLDSLFVVSKVMILAPKGRIINSGFPRVRIVCWKLIEYPSHFLEEFRQASGTMVAHVEQSEIGEFLMKKKSANSGTMLIMELNHEEEEYNYEAVLYPVMVKKQVNSSNFSSIRKNKNGKALQENIRNKREMRPLRRHRRKAGKIAITAVVGQNIYMPCDVTPRHSSDSPQMLMWLKDSDHTPLFSVDFRGKSGRPQIWRDTASSLAQRASLHLTPRASSKTRRELKFEDSPRANRSPKRSEQLLDQQNGIMAASKSGYTPTGGIEVADVRFLDTGIYRCRVDFLHSPTRNAKVNVTVVVPPKSVEIYKSVDRKWKKVPASNVGPIDMGTNLKLKCLTGLAWPPPQVIWLDGDQIIDKSSSLLPNSSSRSPAEDVHILSSAVNYLTLTHLGRDDHGKRLSCVAANMNGTKPAARTITLKIALPVLGVELDPISTVTSGEVAEIQCTVWGSYPPPKVKWYLGNIPQSATQSWVSEDSNVTVSMLTLTAEGDQDGEMVTCLAQNPAVLKSTSINQVSEMKESRVLSVQYSPKLTAWLGKSLDATKIKEGDDVYFECSVQSKPKPQTVYWSHQGTPLVEGDGILVSNMTLVLQTVNRKQAGEYTCHATNDIGSSASNSVPLDIKFAPVCGTAKPGQYSVAKLENARIACQIHANPANVTFSWTFNNTAEVVGVPRDRYVVEGLESVVNYTPMTELDYGTLLCKARNTIGAQSIPCVFQIIAAGKPEPPHNCKLKDVTLSFLEVTCIAGSNGGEAQSFLLQVMETRVGGDIVAQVERSTPNFSVTNLKPATSYRLIITAANKRGESKPAHLTVTTSTQPSTRHETSAEPTRGRETSGEIAMGVIVGAILACIPVVLVVVGLIVRSCLKSKHAQRSQNNDIPDSNSRLTEAGDTTTTLANIEKGRN